MSSRTLALHAPRRLAAVAVIGALGVVGLSTPSTAAPRTATYEVTVTNLTSGQPFTPPVWATHRPATEVFTVGAPASNGVRQIAENGNNAPLLAALDDDRHVTASGMAPRTGDGPPPILPGETRAFTIQTKRSGTRLSLAAMLICTNDGFTGLDSTRLPNQVGDTIVLTTSGYDAGTEVNTEDFADIVPPCAPLTGIATTDAGTAMSNPALVEGGVITHHAGITGVDDLLTGLHGWDVQAPVASITVERTG